MIVDISRTADVEAGCILVGGWVRVFGKTTDVEPRELLAPGTANVEVSLDLSKAGPVEI